MQRWALILAAYTYDLDFRQTSEHGNADALSRLPIESQADSSVPAQELYHVEFFEASVTIAEIREASKRDPLLSIVINRLLNGWELSDPSSNLVSFYRKRLELSLADGVILWHRRVPGRADCPASESSSSFTRGSRRNCTNEIFSQELRVVAWSG